MKVTLVACVLLEHENKYLLVQQARSRRQPGKWGPPGGKPDPGEKLTDAALRETREETGLSVELSGFVGNVLSGHRDDPNLFVCFAGRLNDSDGLPALQLKAGEISNGRWLSLEEIERQEVPLRSGPLATMFRLCSAKKLYPLEAVQQEERDGA
ncbi:MAG TPA: NUDIX domain-containing protein [Chloroflexia bacterium]|nr:NUDIX domain-containing protein [Chloroflexia bacterium]